MNSKYEQEVKDFLHNFIDLRGKHIVLYGIGRYTATLLDGLADNRDFDIIGLMDKEPSNIGKWYFALPVLSAAQVQERADAVIINTAGTYWKLIYQRIKDIGIPVYYRNGELAEEKKIQIENQPYWQSSLEKLQQKISEAEVVSFDFFDTLFSRSVCNPKDVIRLMDSVVSRRFPAFKPGQWTELRCSAVVNMSVNYSMEDLYEEIALRCQLDKITVEELKRLELDLELKLLLPRNEILACLKEAIKVKKDVYIISDMYLPISFFKQALENYDICLPAGNILVSGYQGKSKADGSLWHQYKAIIVDRKAFHVGDNLESDIKASVQYGIDAFWVASAIDILQMSSMQEIGSKICSIDASLTVGKIIGKLFSNPFVLNRGKGKIRLTTNFDMGYFVFGPVILIFFRWLIRQARQDDIKRLIFMSRDGYLLQEDFKEFLSCSGEAIDFCYIGISRQLAMTAAVESEKDIETLLNMPYTGSFSELLEDRFAIQNVQNENKANWRKYLSRMQSYVSDVRRRYKKYIKQFKFTEQDAIVDIGYYGNNQFYLNKIAGAQIHGYYFNANCAKDNPNTEKQSMKACFQSKDDCRGAESGILKYQIFLESLFTAPYGMVKDLAEDGSFICKERKHNQMFFAEKEKINAGIKAWIKDFKKDFQEYELIEDRMFIDEYYRLCFEYGMEFSNDVKQSFYNDNALMNRLESNLFC